MIRDFQPHRAPATGLPLVLAWLCILLAGKPMEAAAAGPVLPPGGAVQSVERASRARVQASAAARQRPATAAVPTVTATMTDEVVTDPEGDGAATPGDTIRYRVVVANGGPGDVSGGDFATEIDEHTTLVEGSPNLSPLAGHDTYVSVGNTLLVVGDPPGFEPVVWRPGSLFDNDVEFLGDGYTLIGYEATSTGGGTVTIAPSGTFTYLPAAGFTGTDTFHYTIGDARGLTSTATVSIVVSGRLWYVRAGGPAGGTGRSNAPFNSLAPLNGANGFGDVDVAGDILFLHESSFNYETALVLEPNQHLIGQGVDLVVDPGTGPITLVTATNRPFLVPPSGGTAVTLSSGNAVRGIHVISTNGHGIFGASVGAFTLDHVGIETSASTLDRQGLSLTNGTLAVDVDSLVVTSGGSGVVLNACTGTTTLTGVHVDAKTYGLSATNAGTLVVTGNTNTLSSVSASVVPGAALRVTNTTIGVGGLRFRSISAQKLSHGIQVENTGTLGGLIVTGVGIDYSGGTISGCTDGMLFTNLRSVTISSVGISNCTNHHVDATSLTNGLRLTRVLMSGAPNGLVARNVFGNSLLNSCSITGSTATQFTLLNDAATTPAPGIPDYLSFTGCTVTGATTGTGALVQGSGTANLRVVVTGGTFSSNGNEGLDVRASGGSTVDLRVSGTALNGNAGDGIDLVASNRSRVYADIRNLVGVTSSATPLFVATRDSAILEATIENVGITGSSSGVGMECEQVGTSSLIARIAGCNTSGTWGSGILGEAFGGTGLLSMTLASNQVAAPLNGSSPTSGIFLQASDVSGGTNTVCLQLTGNSSAGSATGTAYTLRQRPGTTFQLQDFTGNGQSSASVANWVNVVKGNTGSVSATFASGFTSSTGCAAPGPLPTIEIPADDPPAPPVARPLAAAIVLAPGSLPELRARLPLADDAGPEAPLAPASAWSAAIGTIPAGRSISMVFDVVVNNPLTSAPSHVAAHGTFTGAGIEDVPTDDPEIVGNADSTVTPILLTRDLGVIAVLAPVTGCVGPAGEPVTLSIRNFTTVARSGFDVSYTVTGPIGTGPVVENVGALSVPAGATAQYTFATLANLSAAGSYTVTGRTLLAGDSNPDNDASAANVTARPSPLVNAGNDRTVSPGGSTTLGGSPTATGGLPPYTYAWAPTAGLNDPASANPLATLSAPMTYAVTVTDANGCSGIDSVFVQVVAPGSFEARVAASANDAEESSGGSVNLTSTDLELVNDGNDQVVGMRFASVAIPPGSTVQQAWVQFTAKEAQSVATSLTIQGQAADSAALFTTGTRNVSLRPRTSASVSWTPASWIAGQAGAAQLTPSLTAVVQEIVGRPGWRSGSALALIVTGTGHRTAYAWDGGATQAALLHVDYLTPAAPNAAPTVSAGSNQTIQHPAQAALDGTMSDDGLPNPPAAVTLLWEKVSGPGAVTFVNPNAVDTQASFDLPGTYVLRLSANDGAAVTRDSVTINAQAPSTTVERRVAAGSDDAEESAAGNVDVTSTVLQLVDNNGLQTVGLRFSSLLVPRNATITAAWVQFTADASHSGATSLTFRAQDADHAPAFAATTGNVSTRPRTPASVAWTPAAWTAGQAGLSQRTPDLSALFQAVVNRPGWTSGNALALIVTGTGVRAAESFEGAAALAPLLHVEYANPVADAGDSQGTGIAMSRARVIPHPVHRRARFELEIARPGPVRLEIFDVQGRKVGTLLDRPELAAGRHTVPLDARWQAGLYFYRLTAPDRVASGRLSVVD